MEKQISRVSAEYTYDGFAAEDIEKESVVLKIICPELAPHTATGTLGAGISQGTVALKGRDGEAINSPINATNHITATWGGASNMRYPPLIRKGEPVELYKKGNQDKWYWRASGKGRDFRTTDRIHIEVGASDPSKPGSEKTDENTYSAYLDSDGKKVGLKTSQANGEVTAFSMEADLEKGTFHISDNNTQLPNRIFLDTGAASGVPVLQMNLSTGATIKIVDKDIFIKTPGKLMIDVGDRMVVNSPLTVFNLNKSGAFIINAASIALNGAKDVVMNAATIGLNGATKVGGFLVAAAARIASITNGGAGGNYTAVSVNRPEDSPVSQASNSPDTSASGSPYKT